MPSSTANASVKPNAGSETRRSGGILMGWPVVAGIPRWYILRPQRDPDPREALDRPMTVRLAQRMLAVPGLLEQGRQGLRRFAGDMEPLDRETLELPRGEGALGGDPARAEQRAEPAEARQDHGPDVPAHLEFLDRVLHRVGRGVPGRGVVSRWLTFDLDDPCAAAEEDDQDDDRREDGQPEEQAEGRTGGDRPSRSARGPGVPRRRGGLADPERLEHPGPCEQEGDDQDEGDRRGDDLPPGERLRRCLLANPPAEERVDEDRDDETQKDDEEQVSHERVEDTDRARFGAARGAPSGNRLAPGVEVRDVEGERRDEQDRQKQEQRDRPLRLPPPRADHVCAKAPWSHNGFPDSRRSREVTRRRAARRTAPGAAGRRTARRGRPDRRRRRV